MGAVYWQIEPDRLACGENVPKISQISGQVGGKHIFSTEEGILFSHLKQPIKKTPASREFGDTKESWGPRQPDNPSAGSQLKS